MSMTRTHQHKTVLYLDLGPMPQGMVMVGQGAVWVNAFGLTPGSAHAVELAGAYGTTPLGTLTANAVGQASATFTTWQQGWNRLVILDGAPGTAPIAVTSPLSYGYARPLHAVEAGFPVGSLQGYATLVYDPYRQTITITVTASGLTPGPHAAHIHVGSCESQCPVQYMLQDFIADGYGNIDHQTRVVTGVTSLPATGWYLNLHQGNSNDILSNGQPTIFFRPLLCANI
jgi:CHRD domain